MTVHEYDHKSHMLGLDRAQGLISEQHYQTMLDELDTEYRYEKE